MRFTIGSVIVFSVDFIKVNVRLCGGPDSLPFVVARLEVSHFSGRTPDPREALKILTKRSSITNAKGFNTAEWILSELAFLILTGWMLLTTLSVLMDLSKIA